MIGDTLTVYRTRIRRQWRWSLTAANHEIVGASSEAYRNQSDCITNAARVVDVPAPILSAAAARAEHVLRPNSPFLWVVIES